MTAGRGDRPTAATGLTATGLTATGLAGARRQRARSDDSLWAARAPLFSDSTIQYGSSSVGTKVCPSCSNRDVLRSTARPVVRPWDVFHDTRSPREMLIHGR